MFVYCMHMRETVTQWSNISFARIKLDDNVDNVVDLRLLMCHFLKIKHNSSSLDIQPLKLAECRERM